MNWRKYGVIFCFLNCFLLCASVTDEEYASMPDIFHVEDYDSCMALKDKALYCTITYEFTPINPNSPPEVWRTIKEVSSSEMHYKHNLLRHFICVPKSCPTVKVLNSTLEDIRTGINRCYNNKYRSLGFQGKVEVATCKGAGALYEIDTVDWIFAIVFFLYIGFVLLCTLYEYKKKENAEDFKVFKESQSGKAVLSFSIISNWNKLKHIPTGPIFEKLRPVQSIRVYFSIIVLTVHAGVSQIAVPVTNPKFIEDMNDYPNFTTEFPKRAVFMLSFFFVMSSWMVISGILAKLDKKEEIDCKFVIKSIIKRYLRFLPSVAFVVGFYATWFRHIPWGPFFEAPCNEVDRCRKNWWTNILFIQNHYDRYFMCHIVTWYLAVEMQYYVMTLLLLTFILRKNISIPKTVSVLLVIITTVAFLDHYRYGFPSVLSGNPELVYKVVFNQRPQWHVHFASFYGNAAGYILGLGFGYIAHKYSTKKIFDEQWKKTLWAVVSFGCISLSLLLPFVYDVDATPLHSAIWVALTRPLFSLGTGLFVLGLSEGLGGLVRTSLTWDPLYILGKLSYCVYIFHTVFQHIRVGVMRTPGHVSYYQLIQITAADTLISFIGSLWLSLFFEMPSHEIVTTLLEPKRKAIEKKSN